MDNREGFEGWWQRVMRRGPFSNWTQSTKDIAQMAWEARAAIEGGPQAAFESSDGENQTHGMVVRNLAMLVRRLAHRIMSKYKAPDDPVAKQAWDYLMGEGLQGSPLRSDDEWITEKAAQEDGADVRAGRLERVLEAPPREQQLQEPKLSSESGRSGLSHPVTVKSPLSPASGDKVLIEATVLEPINTHGRVYVQCDSDEYFYVNTSTIHPVPAAAPLPTAREAIRLDNADFTEIMAGYDSGSVKRETVMRRLNEWIRIHSTLAAPQPVSGLQRTAGDVLRQFRESGSEDWGELESAINWWAMNEFCPNFTKGDRAVSEGKLREALEAVIAADDIGLNTQMDPKFAAQFQKAARLCAAALESA